MAKNKVTIYGTAWCGPCVQLRRRLDDEQIEYDYKNVDEKAHETAMLAASNGHYLIPTVVTSDKVMQNPTLDMVKQAISS